ncbi:MAG: hypothetical protein U0694_18490 [Anaerolineae bacterium]
MKKYVFFAMVFLLALSVRAQEETPQYRLRVPTAEEYLRAVPTIAPSANDAATYPILAIMRHEIDLRYTRDELRSLPFDIFWEAYGWLILTHIDTLYSSDWLTTGVDIGLREEDIDLSQTTQFTLGYYLTIEVQPIDFNGDGQDEYVLYVDDSGFRRLYLIARHSENAYNLTLTPIPELGSWGTWGGETEGRTLKIEDVNDDMLVEWVVLYSGWGAWRSFGKLYIIGWHDNAFVDLAAGGFDYQMDAFGGDIPTPQWSFIVQDGVTYIEMRYRQHDGWGCGWEIVESLDWQEPLASQTTYDASLSCVIREAEIAFQAQDYGSAIRLYETGLEQYAAADPLTQYAQTRLALAYAFNGQAEEALSLLTNSDKSGLMGELLEQMRAAYVQNLSANDLCYAAYNFFLETNPRPPENSVEMPPSPYIGFPLDFQFGNSPDPHGIPLPEPTHAGCDINQVQPSPTFTPSTPYEYYVHGAGDETFA